MDTLKEKDSQMQAVKEQYNQVYEQLKERDNHITDLEFELLSLNSELNKSNGSFNIEKKDDGSEKVSSFWMAELEEKDKEIERLEGELRKRTCDLQGLVNKELWEKNREIERMQNRFGNIVENKDREISKLEKIVSSKETQLNILKDKISELGVQVELPDTNCDELNSLREQLKACLQERKYFIEQIEKLQQKLKTSSDSEIYRHLQQLKTDYKNIREELEKSEKLRSDTNEICYVLSTRLEELAQFLDSLLQQKSVLGFLGWKANKKLKQIVNQSLDLSRALSMNLTQNPDQSLLQLSNISNLLNQTRAENVSLSEFFEQNDEDASTFSIIPADVSLTYQSHLHKKSDSIVEEQAKIINVLREQIENLKHEVELRDNELNKQTDRGVVRNDQDLVNVLLDLPSAQSKVLTPKKIMDELLTADKSKSSVNTSTTLKNRTENQSESESWSEPDRTVSLARIGLDDDSLKPASSSSGKRGRFLTSMSTESTEDEMPHALNRTPSKRSLLAENRQTIVTLHEQVCEMETKLKIAEASAKEEKLINEKRQKRLDELLDKLNETEEKLVVADKRRQKAEQQVEKLQKTVEDLQEAKDAIERHTEYKNKTMLDRINELEIEKQKAIEAAKMAEKLATEAKSDLKEAEMKLRKMQEEIVNVETNMRQECEQNMTRHLESAQREFEMKLQAIENRAEVEIKKARSSVEEMQATYEREYVRRSEVDKRVLEVEIIVQELENLKEILNSAEQKMQSMEEREFQLKETLRNMENQHREKINKLRKELDTATLQYSETVLEKTKIANEKAALEEKIKSYTKKENELLSQVMDFQKQVSEMRETFHKQVSTMDNQKSKLEVRVSELESTNAELRNKLIKMQTGIGDHPFSMSLPTSPNRAYDFYNQNIPVPPMIPYRRQCSDNSGYTSEEPPVDEIQRGFVLNEHVHGVIGDAERHQANSSPDLGIESDQGRFSSLEAAVPRPVLQTLELTESMSNLLDGDNNRIQDVSCSKFIYINYSHIYILCLQ